MNRIEILTEIIDNHIYCLSQRTDPMLNDTKTLTEILKAILVLENIKKLEGTRSEFDSMTDDDLESKLNGIGE